MSKIKPYKEQETVIQKVDAPMVAYTSNERSSGIVTGERDDIKCAISGEELLGRFRPRIKALFK